MSLSVNEEIYNRNAVSDFGLLPSTSKSDQFNITTTQSTVVATSTINAASPCFVYKNGKLLRYTTDYSISGTTVTFVSNLVNGDFVVLMYTV